MTKLSRGAILAMAREATPGTYLAPTFTVPYTGNPAYDTVYTPLWDESVRNSDTVKQGLYQGPGDSTWDMTFNAYPDILGNFLRIIGTDTVTPATTTTTSGSTIIGATSVQTAATIPINTMISIDTAANQEYAYVTAVSGVGPYTLTVTTVIGQTVGLAKAHNSAVAVTTQTTHTFKQNVASTRPPSWSISVYDQVDYRGFAGCQMSELAIKIDPKAAITAQAKFTGYPEATVSSFVYGGTNIQPNLGWGWTMTNAGASSTRGITLDLTLKRAVEAIHSSDGVQAPREVFAGALELDATYKAIYEDLSDYSQYLTNAQQPATATLQKAAAFGGESLAITMSQSGWSKGTRNLSGAYVDATFNLSAIANTTDGGIVTAVLKNWVTTQY